jgi:hypothetical protein
VRAMELPLAGVGGGVAPGMPGHRHVTVRLQCTDLVDAFAQHGARIRQDKTRRISSQSSFWGGPSRA